MNNILVGNLNPNVTEQDIRSLFEPHGTVQRSKMMTDRWTVPCGSRGICSVHLSVTRSASVAAASTKELFL